MRRIAAAALLAVCALPFQIHAALAHPLGNFTVNRYSRIEVAPTELHLRYVLDLAEIPTLQELAAAGLAGDVSSEVARAALLPAKAAQLASGARLALAGQAIAWTTRDATFALLPGQAGLSTMRVTLRLGAAVVPRESDALTYRDANYPGRLGWHEIVLRGVGGIVLASSDTPAVDATDELRSYPADPAVAPRDQSAANATLRLGTISDAAPSVAGPIGAAGRFAVDRAADQLTGFLRGGASGDPLVLLAALAVAVALGALHALGPGHGKTIVGAYLVGSRGTPAHAVLLGATVTATHTVGVYALGLLALVAAEYVLPERLYPVLGLLSGLLVVGIGAALVRSRLGVLRGAREHDHGHLHNHGGAGPHHHGETMPRHEVSERPSLRGLIGLGVSGGLLPCPTALVVLLAALSFHSVVLGMLLVAAFSLGLAAVLTGIGLALVAGRRYLSRTGAAARLASSRPLRALPALSAAAITLAGALIALDALRTLVSPVIAAPPA